VALRLPPLPHLESPIVLPDGERGANRGRNVKVIIYLNVIVRSRMRRLHFHTLLATEIALPLPYEMRLLKQFFQPKFLYVFLVCPMLATSFATSSHLIYSP
jgi:hypothetical protein